jgi:hypothetical protein
LRQLVGIWPNTYGSRRVKVGAVKRFLEEVASVIREHPNSSRNMRIVKLVMDDKRVAPPFSSSNPAFVELVREHEKAARKNSR